MHSAPRPERSPTATRGRVRLALVVGGAIASVALVATAAAGPFHDRLGAAVGELGSVSPPLLVATAGWVAAALMCGALGWRGALRSCGRPITTSQCVARFAVGAALGATTPARIGGAVRLGLFARACGIRATGASAAALAAAHTAAVVPLAIGAGLTGLVPLWACAALAAGGSVSAALAVWTARRVQVLLVAVRWAGLATLARVGAAACAGAALGAPRPLLAALLVVPATNLAAFVPVTPGALGVSTAAAALAFASAGAGSSTALAAALALGLVETAAALALGLVGVTLLAGVRLPGRRRVLPALAVAPVPVEARAAARTR